MKIQVKKSRGFKGEIPVPGDKSISHRAAFIGSLGLGETEISNFSEAGDCLATLRCLQEIGAEIKKEKGCKVTIQGKNLYGFREPEAVLEAQNSGTTARFLAGLLSGQNFFSVISGDSSLQKRPMKRVVEPLQKMGAWIDGRNGGSFLPLAVRGQRLKGIKYKIPIPSAQLKSSLILASLLAHGKSEIEESLPSRDHTERMLGYFGADIKRKNGLIEIYGERRFKGQKIIIPGDFSSASFFITAAMLVENSNVVIPDVGLNPTRTGFLRIVEEMKGQISIHEEKVICGEPVGTLVVSSSMLKGVEIKHHVIPTMIDEIPLISLLATQAKGKTVVKGASELRVKESDRIAAVVSNLRKMGVEIDEMKDGFTVEGPQKLKGASVQSFGDHRIAMAMAVAGLAAEGGTEIEGFSCHSVSFPHFYTSLKKWENG
ncbi:MAG: 3-phosphoshikimate 1-carboxyvinyltransferase [Candidatus Aminicenantes bacterium]